MDGCVDIRIDGCWHWWVTSACTDAGGHRCLDVESLRCLVWVKANATPPVSEVQ